jgi:hypothetical protein
MSLADLNQRFPLVRDDLLSGHSEALCCIDACPEGILRVAENPGRDAGLSDASYSVADNAATATTAENYIPGALVLDRQGASEITGNLDFLPLTAEGQPGRTRRNV